MTLQANVTKVLNGTIQSVKSILPMSVKIDSPTLFKESVLHSSMSVLIGMTGDVKGRLVIDGTPHTFSSIGEGMYGMQLEGEMLESFTGELGNMIAGHLATNASQYELIMDITPPTVLVGDTKLTGFKQAIRVPISLETSGHLDVILMIEGQKTV
ncbi:chemotaxis protein CheX [Bacillus suaedaesalsae]|uniref:Chemotaxis protein CheX n=1 Tax=Bacillus suaedaesalsae TaxID=2810349 RepID=A0ABS2DHZ2_9BACI|nr:chemotaxis protein CheX [Bacillus suaedaesalsae]MBM6618107.1 chemotaxis protein CheX [Bacillus suaedaesalsae]